MKREETVALIRSIVNLYPNWKPENLTETVNAWQWALEEYPAQAVKAALQMYVRTNNTGFAPSVSQIINGIYKPMERDILSEGEAWNLVKRAIQDGNYHAEERFAELPETVQRAVGSANMIRAWAQTDSDEVNSVVMSNFQRNYRTVVHRETEEKKIGSLMTGLTQAIIEKQEGMLIDKTE